MNTAYVHSLLESAANGAGTNIFSPARRAGHMKSSAYVVWNGVASVSRITITIEGRQSQNQSFTPLATVTEADFSNGRMGGTAHIDDLRLMAEMRGVIADMSISVGQSAKIILEVT